MANAILDESGANLVVVDGALIEQQPINALTAYAPGNIQTLLGVIRAKVLADAEGLDASTPKRREALKSLAAKVARTKTTLDGLGKDLTEDWKRRAAVIDRERRQVRDELDELKALVRRPVTDWEAAEEERIARETEAVQSLEDAASVPADATSAEIESLLEQMVSFYEVRVWDPDFKQRAARAFEVMRGRMTVALELARRREAEAAELARLRAEAAEREAAAREVERVAGHQAALKALREFEFFTEDRVASEDFVRRIAVLEQPSTRNWEEFADEASLTRAAVLAGLKSMHKRALNHEAQLAEAAREEAAQQAKLEAERRAEEARVAAERRAQAEVEAAATRQAAAEEAARQAELRAQQAALEAEERLQRERQEAKAHLERLQALEAERKQQALVTEAVEAAVVAEPTAARKAEVQRAVIAALATLGATDRAARTIWAAIAAGRVPHVAVSYGE